MSQRTILAVGLGSVVVLGATWTVFWRGDDETPPGPALQVDRAAAAATQDAWNQGKFSRLAGRDIRADLDRHLMLDIQADMPDGAEEALREKLSTFLIAYSSTDYEKYLVFRPSSTMCAIDDPRLRQQLEAWPPQLGPVPTEAAGVFAAPWRLYIAEGFGPIAAGPVIDAVKWAHCRATIRKILQQQVIGAEWDEMAPGDGHLSKEASPDAKTEGGFVSIRLCVPNVTSVAELVKRDGVLRFADFDVVCRAADSPARRLVLRFVWDGVDRTWLALHALVYGGDPRKSFVW